jgi:hypothetical protein
LSFKDKQRLKKE